jgi:hypothetical protein
MDDKARIRNAKQRVAEIRGFYQHFALYLFVNMLLIAINLAASPKFLWFYWVLIGWGFGIGWHFFSTFAAHSLWGSDWEERKIQEMTGSSGSSN